MRRGYQLIGGSAATVLLAAILSAVLWTSAGGHDPAAFVNPFLGTGDTTTQTGVAGIGPGSLSGQSYPGASEPFGMLQWSPDTNADQDPIASYQYHDGETTLAGFSLLHNDGVQYRYVPFLPLVGPVTVSPATDPQQYYGEFRHQDEQASPGYYRVKLASGVGVELTSTLRGGLARFTFPKGTTKGLLLTLSDTSSGGADDLQVDAPTRTVEGYATANGVRLYFVAHFDQPITGYGTYLGASVRPGANAVAGPESGGWVDFGGGDGTVEAQVAVSYVDEAGAAGNLESEIVGPKLDFATAVAAARASWDRVLGRFAVADTATSTERTFYTALYETLLQPNLASDVDGRYLGWDGKVHSSPAERPVYTTFSSWDMSRSLLPFLAVFFPDETADMMQSLVDAYQQSGGWAYRLVTGTRVSDPNTGDWSLPALAYLLGVRGFDAQAALAIATQTATVPDGNPIRPGLSFYQQHGWVPATDLFSAEDTIDDATTDYVVSQFAAALGNTQVARVLGSRAADWQNVFSSSFKSGTTEGYVWSRQADGAFSPGWSPAAGSCYGPFEEGTSAQYSFSALDDIAGEVTGMGGNAAATSRLDSLLRRLNDGCLSTAAYIGNEPGFALPWLYDWVGAPSQTQATVRRVIDQLFSDTPGGLPGNDDWGTMSAYYVWSALGMYPVVPGVPGVALATPSLGRVTISLENGRTVQIVAGSGAAQPYIDSLTLDGQPYNSPWLTLSDISKGTSLHFDLGAEPTSWGTRPPAYEAPPSHS